jgi:hypothetical protein
MQVKPFKIRRRYPGRDPASASRPSNFVQLFVGVHDVKRSVKHADELGARRINSPTILRGMTVLLHLQGMSFRVHRHAKEPRNA